MRVTATGPIGKPQQPALTTTPGRAEPKCERLVWFAESGFAITPIYDRYTMGEGARIDGPAIVEEMDSTTVILPKFEARIDRFGNLIVEQTR